MSDSPPNPLAIDSTLLQELGRIIVYWAYLEDEVSQLLARLLGAQAGRIYVVTKTVSAASAASWTRLLSDIEFQHEPQNLAVLRELFADIDDARADRNAYMHGLWHVGPEPNTAIVTTVRWDRPEIIKHELVTLHDLQALATRAGELKLELDRIRGQFWPAGVPDAGA